MEPSAPHQQTLSEDDPPDQAFGPFILSHRRKRLLRDGEPVPLKPKVFALLVVLVSGRERVLSRDVLMDELWPRQIVEESSLTQAIYELRRALGDPGLVENLPRRGYRFTGDVHDLPVTDEAASPAHSLPVQPPPHDPASAPVAPTAAWPVRTALAGLLALMALFVIAVWPTFSGRSAPEGAVAAGPVHDPARIVVLPFKDTSPDASLQFLGDGIADTLQRGLAGVAELSVIARASAFAYRDQDISSIAEALQVGTVLDGSIQRAGDTLRVSAQLVRTADQTQLWSVAFERDADDIFAIQDDIADRVVEAVTGEDALGLRMSRLPQTTREVYDLYLQGRELWQRRDARSIREAIDRLETAVRLDPSFAPARSELATALMLSPDLSRLEKVALVEPQLEAALALDPTDAQSHAIRGSLLLEAGRIVEGRRALAHALELRPNDVNILGWLAWGYQVSGLMRSAETHTRRAFELDPMNVFARIRMVNILLHTSPAEAQPLALQTVRLFPESAHAWGVLALSHQLLGDRVADALAAADGLGHAPESPELVYRIASAFNQVGEFEVADAWRERIPAFELGPQAELFWHLARDDPQAVVERTRTLLARHGETPDALAWHGRALVGTGEYAEAEAMLERALANGPDLQDAANVSWSQAEVPVLLAGLAMKRGDLARARELEAMALPAIEAVRTQWPAGAQERAFFLDVAMQRHAEAASRVHALPHGFRLVPLISHVHWFEGVRADANVQAVIADEMRERETQRQRLLDSGIAWLADPSAWQPGITVD